MIAPALGHRPCISMCLAYHRWQANIMKDNVIRLGFIAQLVMSDIGP
jgi:hypothetical protein